MNSKNLLLFFLACFSLAACGGVKEQLGIAKHSPDEFAVVKRAPLALPPDQTSLPVPRPGAPRPQEQMPALQAKQTVFGPEEQMLVGEFGTSSSENLLLQQAGAVQTDPNIRARIDYEAEQMKDYNKPVAQKLFGIGGDKDEPSATVVDAAAEAERLKANREAGKPVTEGETPSIDE